MSDIIFREPTINDADSIWNLIKNSKPLDVNSKYLYVLLCHEFSKTCVVAEYDSNIVGFLSAFVSPKRSDTLFVWQAAVAEHYQNKGVAQELMARSLSQAGPFIRYVNATVTPSNNASLNFLHKFAKSLNALITKNPLFPTSVLGDGHEPEDLVCIGPIPEQVKEVTA